MINNNLYYLTVESVSPREKREYYEKCNYSKTCAFVIFLRVRVRARVSVTNTTIWNRGQFCPLHHV